MASTLLLDTLTWDLVLDAHDDVASADEPYALAQDAASAIKTFQGEAFWDTTLGVPWLSQILGKNPPLTLIKAQLVAAAESVPDVSKAQVFLTGVTDRVVVGQVQVTQSATGQVVAANFSSIDPQVA